MIKLQIPYACAHVLVHYGDGTENCQVFAIQISHMHTNPMVFQWHSHSNCIHMREI